MPLTRRLILQKARHHPHCCKAAGRALTDCRHTVSGTISLPARGTFHLSLTVLVRYRSSRSIRLNGWSRQIHTPFQGWRVTWEESQAGARLRLRGYHPLWRRFPTDLDLTHTFLLPPPPADDGRNTPTTPRPQPLPGITRPWFSLIRFRSPLLSESLLFSLPTGTEMFHFPVFPHHTLCVQVGVTGHDSSWVSPFGNPRINA